MAACRQSSASCWHLKAALALSVAGLLAVGSAQQLIECLERLDADLVSAQDVDQYDLARQVANKRVLREPIAIVYPRSVAAVQGAVNCSRLAGFPAVPRSGGHGYEGYSVQDNSVVVDLARYMGNYTSLGGLTAEIGAGIRLGPLYYAAWQDGQKAFPGGTCPAVGVGGHLLGGAWGLLARAYGLGCDRIRQVTMVDAQGQLIVANSSHNTDLLWASCGGGGGNFGIVTSMLVRMVQPPANVTFVWTSWPMDQLETLFQMWQSFAPKTDARFTSELYMSSSVVEMHGLFMGSKADCDKLLESSGILGVPGITYKYYSESDFLTAAIKIAGMTEGIAPDQPVDATVLSDPTWAANEAFKAKSYNVQNPASLGAISAISSALSANPAAWVQLSAFGGAVNRVAWRSTAYAQRGMLFNIQYYIAWDSSSQQSSSLAWIDDLQAQLDKFFPANSYLNYLDANVTGGTDAYFTGAYPRLQTIKRKYDPGNYFNYPSSIALT